MTHTEEEFFDLRDIIGILRRQIRLILLTFVIVLALAFAYVVRATPLYTATALIKVNPQETNLLDPTGGGALNASTESTRIETEVEVLKSSGLALKTIEATALTGTSEFGPQIGLFDRFRAALGFDLPPLPSGDVLVSSTLSKFQDSLSIRRRGLTYLVQVSATSPNPDLSAELANVHAQTYQDDQVSGKVQASIASRDVLSTQLERARVRLAESNDSLQNYIETNIEALADDTNSEDLRALAEQLKSNTLQFSTSTQTLASARSALDEGNFETLATQLNDDALLRLERQRAALRARLGQTAAGSAEAIDLAAGLASIEESLNERGELVLSELSQDLETFERSRTSLMDEIQLQVLQSELSGRTLTDIYGLQQEASIAQTQYDQLIRRIRELEDQAVVQVANSRIVSKALVPLIPSFPNKKLTLALAFVVALGLGVGLAIIKEFFFGGVTSANQLSNIMPVKVGAVVPKMANQTGTDALADRIVEEQLSQFSESYRKLRASIDQHADVADDEGMVVLVSSAIPAEGKSTSALSLARTYALAGKRTLLVDADLRNPAIHKSVKEEPETGLMEYILREQEKAATLGGNQDALPTSSVEEFYVVDPKTRLGIILGSHRANIPTDAPLQSQIFRDLINNARKAFDVVIIDTAPLLPVVDTRYIAPLVDVAVMCVRFGEATQNELRTSYGHLAESLSEDTPVIAVLNAFEGANESYRYDGYYSTY